MIIKNCIFYDNECYTTGTPIIGGHPKGIVVHSTGANNPCLKRYVQPSKNDPYRDEIIADIGKNIYNNHFNLPTSIFKRQSCVHAFIGKNADGVIEIYRTLPDDICCWGVGRGKNGSYNYNPDAYYQFEMCEDGLNDWLYFNNMISAATEYCAYLCKLHNIPTNNIVGHNEAYKLGYGSNHADPEHWLKKIRLFNDRIPC